MTSIKFIMNARTAVLSGKKLDYSLEFPNPVLISSRQITISVRSAFEMVKERKQKLYSKLEKFMSGNL